MEPRKGLLVIGNLNIDRIYSVESLPLEGESTPITGESTVFGGCGGNIASAAGKLGIPVRLCSVIGRDFPESYTENLLSSGVDLEPVVVSDSRPSPYCVILSAPGGRQVYAFNFGSMNEQGSMEVPVASAMSHVHIATSDPEFSIRAARALRDIGSSVAIDPGMEIFYRWSSDQLARVLPLCGRFFGNLGEWKHLGKMMDWEGKKESIGGVKIPRFDEPFTWMDEAVITMGSKGALLINSTGIQHAPLMKVEQVVDATGAGDAFRGGFYAALLDGYSSREALDFGNAMGSISVGSKGPQDFDADWEQIKNSIE